MVLIAVCALASALPARAASAACEPTTCEAAGKDCGTIDDGCGGTLECGGCNDPMTCGGSGVENVCGEMRGEPAPQPEPAPEPACVPKSCEEQGKDCGMIDDGCGHMIGCPKGNCVPPESCGGAGVPFVCGIAPAHGTTLDQLLARGDALVAMDPLLGELRQHIERNSVRAFLIGLAASEGQTEPGPGKQKIRDSLPAATRDGFDVAVDFTLTRNRNAHFAEVGAAIAEADPVVASARNALQDVFSKLGFDIASGIFGDPALGAQGNTQTGPGSMRIRDSLGVAVQQGFDASVKLHLSRHY
jgi:hypothetical protein